MLDLSLAERISYDAERNTLFLNFEGLHVRTRDDVDRVRRVIENAMPARSAGRWRWSSTTTASPSIPRSPTPTSRWSATWRRHYYTTASRYTTSAFMRLKLGAGLSERDLKPHVFETPAEAHAFAAAHNAP